MKHELDCCRVECPEVTAKKSQTAPLSIVSRQMSSAKQSCSLLGMHAFVACACACGNFNELHKEVHSMSN